MKKPKFKYVESKQENGCSIACTAIILGKEYDDVAVALKNDFSKEGIQVKIIASYLSENGVDVTSKEHLGYSDRDAMNKHLIKPFADIHYISFRQFADSDFNHAIVMLANGKLVCPNIKYRITTWNIYEIETILGCYYDK